MSMENNIDIKLSQDQTQDTTPSVSTQSQNVTVQIVGCDEKRVREIMKESYEIVEKIENSNQIAWDRELRFEDTCLQRLKRIENFIDNFTEPSVVKTLRKVQSAAICTDSATDYEMLSELLARRIENKDDRKTILTINKAAELIDQISEDALFALTLCYAIEQLYITIPDAKAVADALEDLYSDLIQNRPLPVGTRWIEHLDMLGAIRTSNIGHFKKMDEMIPQRHDHCFILGIHKDSENLQKAKDIMMADMYQPNELFLPNPLHSDYHLLRFVWSGQTPINLLVKTPVGTLVQSPFYGTQLYGKLDEIQKLYEPIDAHRKEMQTIFMQILRKQPTIKALFDWHDSIPNAFNMTEVGKLIASINANRLCSDVKPVEFES